MVEMTPVGEHPLVGSSLNVVSAVGQLDSRTPATRGVCLPQVQSHGILFEAAPQGFKAGSHGFAQA